MKWILQYRVSRPWVRITLKSPHAQKDDNVNIEKHYISLESVKKASVRERQEFLVTCWFLLNVDLP